MCIKVVSNKINIIGIVIVGAGGFGREVLLTLLDCNRQLKMYNVLGFVDDDKSLLGKSVNNIPVLGGLDWLFSNNSKNFKCIIAIGDGKLRKKIAQQLERENIEFATIMHPSVVCSDFVEIGKGTIIQAGSIITPDTKIGEHVHINMDCSVAHDCVLEDFTTLSPGVHINGFTTIGSCVFIGTGAVAKDRVKIGRGSIIGAGTVLIDDVPEFSLYVGIPGKLKKKLTPH